LLPRRASKNIQLLALTRGLPLLALHQYLLSLLALVVVGTKVLVVLVVAVAHWLIKTTLQLFLQLPIRLLWVYEVMVELLPKSED
jgi:hypothetical protein